MPTVFSDTLPADMERGNTCCFTGHRHLSPEETANLIDPELTDIIMRLRSCGYKYFLCGGALGFDMLAEEKVVEIEERFGDIHLVLALPHLSQTERWGKSESALENIKRYHYLKSKAAAVVYISDIYTDGCMKERNLYMVDHSSFCVAYSKNLPRSGSAQTVRMAEKSGITVYNIADSKNSRRFIR